MSPTEPDAPRSATPSTSVDGIPPGARRRTGSPAQAFAACAAGAFALALLTSPGAQQAGDRSFTAASRGMANLWTENLARLGFAWPDLALRRTVRRLIELQWR
jgi:hypothetical protein